MKSNTSFNVFINFVILLFTVVGCINESQSINYQVPDDLIEAETMKKILIDVQLAEAYTQSIQADSTANNVPIEEYYQQIFTIHGTDFEAFQNSFDYYAHFPDSLQLMYEDMLNKLSTIESKSKANVKKRVPSNNSSSNPLQRKKSESAPNQRVYKLELLFLI